MSGLPSEPEFEQAYKDLTTTLENTTLFAKKPEYQRVLAIVAVPERVIQFRVVWEDDNHEVQVNQGFRVQFNSALGPYKGGLRFDPTVNLSVFKFLALEQTLKNALTGLSLGGSKGGADFDPKGKSDAEIRRFCVAFMRELSKYIGADTDIPAGDMGAKMREIGWLFGTYKAQTGLWEGCITGKGREYGGSLMKPQATGYGLVYFVNHMIEYASDGKDSFRSKRVAISGSGNVAQYAAVQAIEQGAIVVSLSDSKGTLIPKSASGFEAADIDTIIALKKQRKQLVELVATSTGADKFIYLEGERPWTHVENVDVALPSATHNEVSADEAHALIAAGCRYVAEGSNMGCSQEAIAIFETHRKEKGAGAIWFAPGKAANVGGSAVSGLEMVQNSQRVTWTAGEVDERLRNIMKSCFDVGIATAKEYSDIEDGEIGLPSLLIGSNIASFVILAEGMRALGDWW